MYDLIIRNCRIVDGTGQPWYRGSVAVKAGKIVKVVRENDEHSDREGESSEISSENAILAADSGAEPTGAAEAAEMTALQIVDGHDHYLAPGFIDIHSHSDCKILAYPTGESRILQGVTTEIGGNCGMSPFPVNPRYEEELSGYLRGWWEEDTFPGRRMSDFLKAVEEKGHSVNFGALVGHGSVRLAAMGFSDQKADAGQMAAMKDYVKEAMEDGAFGMSSGLIYPPGTYADTDELAELSAVMKPYGGMYVTHMRNEGLQLVESVREALEIGKRSGVAVEISHHKATRKEVWHTGCRETIAMMKEARANGQDVTFDQYPYTASSTGMDCNIPSWAFEGGVDALLKRLEDPELKKKICTQMEESHRGRWDEIHVGDAASRENAWTIGKSIPELAQIWNITPEEACIRLVVKERGDVKEIHYGMCDDDVEYIMSQDFGMIGSDGEGVPLDFHGMVHPRYFGAFTRVLAHYCRERKLFSLETAVRKMTGLTAQRLGLEDRGLIREGMWADLVLFDFDQLESTPDFQNPKVPSKGIEKVYVNGILTAENGRHTGAMAGMVLRRKG